MSDTNTLASDGADAPLSLDEATRALLGETEGEVPQSGDTEPEEDEDEANTDDDGQHDDPTEDDGATEDETPEDDGEEDEQEQYDGGRFAADNARVTLPDGSTVTVHELKRGFLREGDYTRKNTELAEQRRAAEAEVQRVKQLEQQIANERNLVATVAKAFLPQEPSIEELRSDPIGYWERKAAYDQQVQQINALFGSQQQDEARSRQEAESKSAERMAAEQARLYEAMPELKDRSRHEAFLTKGAETMAARYGLSSEEFASMATDHRFYLIVRDLDRLSTLQSAKPKVQQQTQGKPPVLKPAIRKSAEAQRHQRIQTASDRLNKSGSLADGVALLMERERAG